MKNTSAASGRSAEDNTPEAQTVEGELIGKLLSMLWCSVRLEAYVEEKLLTRIH